MIDTLMTDAAIQSALPTKSPYPDEFEQYPQSFEVNEKQLPELLTWDVGNAYKLEINVIMKEIEAKDDGSKCAEFVISKVKSLGMAEKQPRKEENNDFVLEEYFNE